MTGPISAAWRLGNTAPTKHNGGERLATVFDLISRESIPNSPAGVTKQALNQKIKSSLYSRCYAEACNEWRDPSPQLSAWATQLRNVQRWRPFGDTVPDLTGIGNRTPDLLR